MANESMSPDHVAVIEHINRFGFSIDMRDWDTYRSLFADQVAFDYSSIDGPTGDLTPDEIVKDAQRDLGGFRTTQHMIANHQVRLTSEGAHCQTHVRAMHFHPNDEGQATVEQGGYYTVDLIRAGEGWKIKNWKFTVLWSKGNNQLFDLVRQE